MKKIIPYILLFLIIVISFITRFYKLGVTPEGFYVDEAGQGYSAYSILKTGKDEFGKTLPIVFRSMTDFRTPVYTYLAVPLISIFGLSPFAIRFPSFLFGVLTVPLIYFLIYTLTRKKYFSLLVSLIAAISPWLILYSRSAYETNVSLFFVILGLLTFYLSLKKPWLLIFSGISFAISIVAYQSERVVVPLILIALFIRFKKNLLDKSVRPWLIGGLIGGLIVLAPTLSIISTPGLWARASGLNIFSHLRQMPDGYIASYSGILAPIINGSWFLSIREFFWQYFSYLSPRFMFNLGDSELRMSFPELSTFFVWQFPFYLIGLWQLIKNKKLGELKFLTLILLFISPIPAAITRDPYSTIRALPLAIPQIIIVSLGIDWLITKVKNKYLKIFTFTTLFVLIVYSLFKLYGSIIILNDYYRSRYWNWGWHKVAEELQRIDQNLPVVVDNARGDVYLQLAFFLKYDPSKYQKDNFEVPLNEYYLNTYHTSEKHIGQITTRPIDWRRDLPIDQYLVGDELGISTQQISDHKLELISEIHYPDGTVAFRIVRTNPEFEMEQQKLIQNK